MREIYILESNPDIFNKPFCISKMSASGTKMIHFTLQVFFTDISHFE